MIYPEHFEEKIGFDRIREMLSEGCLCNLGRNEVDKLQFLTDSRKIRDELQKVEEFKQLLTFEDNFPVDDYHDLSPVFSKIRIEGRFLELEELFQMKKSLETIKAIVYFFKSDDRRNKYPMLQQLVKDIPLFPFIHQRIDKIITSNGRMKDNASPELSDIRSSLKAKENSVSRVMQSVLKRVQGAGLIDSDTTVTIRNGRPVLPVLAGNKKKISGFVHDESATGKTVFIEPAEVVELNNEIRELENAEKRETIKILTVFADDIRPYIEDLKMAYEYLGIIDFMRSKARFAIRINAHKPAMEDKPWVDWFKAVHPLLFLHFQNMNKQVVPLDITLDENNRILLISGPNAGGKSVCLKTVGLLQYMFQCGMLVPAQDNSVFGVFNNVFMDIGDEQSIDNDLSTYSSHLTNLKHFTRNANSKTLVLVDEFGTGTEPLLGGAIAESALQHLNKMKSFGVVTTHYTNLKHFASENEGVINGAMLFDNHRMQPLYKLEIGKPGSSFAFEIARKIGLSEEILKHAGELIGQEHIDFDKHLKDILRDKRYWENKRYKVRQSEKKLDSVIEQYQQQLEEVNKEKKEIIRQAKDEASRILADVNKRIENTIREIKESQANREKTRIARKELESFKEQINRQGEEQDKIDRKINKIKKKQKRQQVASNVDKPEVMDVGDKVRIKNQDTVGEIIETDGDNVVVAFGQMVSRLSREKLEKVSNRQVKRETNKRTDLGNWDVGKRRMKFRPELDVRGNRTDEAIQKVSELIDEAVVVSASELRILHGKGNGILRQMIREYLSTVDVVGSYADAHIELGGSGITVVNLSY